MEEYNINLDNTYMHIIRFGKGEKNLVLVAGITLTGLEGTGSGIEKQYNMFADEYTVYVLDRKKVLPKDYTTEDMAEDIYRTLKSEGVESADLFGVSHGGMIAQRLVENHPETIDRLVLASSALNLTEESYKVFDNWEKLALKADVVSLNRSFFYTVYSDEFTEANGDMCKKAENNGTAADCERFAILCRAIKNFDGVKGLEKIKCPTYVIGSQKDKVFGGNSVAEIAQKLECSLYMYDGYGHAVYDETPDCVRKLYDYLKS